jgi:leader peptidase (prepilin peptidase) / N-methyltransferase
VPRMRTALASLTLAVVLGWLAVLSCYDIRQRRLPNRLTLPGAGVIVLAAAVAGRGLPALAGAAALAGMYLLVHLVAPTGMGAGDVKLAIGLGGLTGCFGAGVWFLAALSAPLLTALCGAVARFRGGAGGTATVPHGPSMCLATAAAAGLAWPG